MTCVRMWHQIGFLLLHQLVFITFKFSCTLEKASSSD